jgi:hypothetical protein
MAMTRIIDGGTIWLNRGGRWLSHHDSPRALGRYITSGAGEHDQIIRASLEPCGQRLPRCRLRNRVGSKARRGKDRQQGK